MIEEIKKSIEEAIKNLSLSLLDFTVEHPENAEFGDYSSNVALVCAKNLKVNPMDLAQKITEILRQTQGDSINRIEIAKPGFINFFLSEDFLKNSLEEILDKGENYGKNKNLKGQKIIIEYTDANPFKEFHIGHIVDNAVGETISRIIEWNGAEVRRANYQGDVGLHIAKAVAEKIKSRREWENEKDVASSYASGSKLYEADKEFADFVIEINKKIYLKNDKEVNEIYELGKRLTLDYFESLYRILGTKFDYYFFESTTAEFGKALVAENKKIFEESDGAVVYRGEKRDPKLHTRVFINKEGLPTYEAKELGLAKIKYDTYPYDLSIVITGNEIKDYFKVILRVLAEIFPDLAKKTLHLSHGMMRLPSGKMSSRTGEVITAQSLIDEVRQKALNKISEGNRNVTDKNKLSQDIAVAAIKYSILKQAIGKDIVFDAESALSFEGDSGPYLQYTYARINSLVENGREVGISPTVLTTEVGTGVVERILYRFPEIVERAYEEFSPQYISTYLIEVASVFNNFYAKNLIVDEKEKIISSHRLAIAKAVSLVIQNGLYLLGVSSPEKM
ncbi:MAG TPA: arginine--tRNA ligase [Candidatus Paceibacterota bacterium]